MTFYGETSSKPSLFDRLVAVLGVRVQRLGAGGSVHERAPRGGTKAQPESVGGEPLLWGLVSFHLGLSVLLSALFSTWFACLILVAHGLLCSAWALVLRERTRAMTRLARRAHEAEERALAKSALLATVSHELRAPLNGILGMSSLLSRSALDARQSEQVGTLRRCAEHLLVMVNDTLDFARLEAGKLPIESTPFEPRLAVDEVLAMHGPRAQEKGIELFAVVERNVPERVLGDMTRVRQALTNLVSNAVKFTASGEVEIRVSAPRMGRLRFSVSDTGIGIAPSARARLFAPFSQADSAITRDYGGSGLGLSISRRLVLAMEGSIDFESTPGIGSRFFFELPSHLEGKSPFEACPPAREQSPNEARVVLVVPHGGTREGLIEVCAWQGFEALCASDLKVLEAPFAAAIVDGSLPTAELQALASHPHRERILVIARATAELPPWARLSLSWPVRQSGIRSALGALMCARVASPAATARGPEEARTSRAAEAYGSAHEQHGAARFDSQTRVLVVEDMPVNQIVAEALLSELGVMVQVVRDGDEALRALQTEPFDLVLMDCQLPTLSGFETTRRLRASLGPNHGTPVIALTGNALEGDEATCREAGMDDYLAKPIRRSELIDKLERWLPSACSSLELESHPERTSIPSNDVGVQEEDPDATSPGNHDLVELAEFMLGFARQVGSSAVERLATTYRESVPDTASCLSRALSERGHEPDRVALAKHAHALRGAARSMGLRALGRRLEELERMSTSADMACLQMLTSNVEARLRIVCDALAARESNEAQMNAREPNREAV